MNYKTILLCAVISASMQNAWGMDLASHMTNLLNNKKSDDLARLILNNQEAFDLMSRDGMIQLYYNVSGIYQSQLKSRSEEGLDAFAAAFNKCSKVGIDWGENQKFKSLDEKIAALPLESAKRDEADRLECGFKLGDIAKEVEAELATYHANKNNNNNKQE